MKRWAWLAVLALLTVPMISFSAVEVQLGTTEAYWYQGDNVRIPIIMTNDVKVMSFIFSLRVTPSAITVDSVVGSGRFDNGKIILSMWLPLECEEGHPQDSGSVVFATNSPFIPVGSGEIGSVWIHGYSLGAQFSIALLDSLTLDPAKPCYNDQHRTRAYLYPDLAEVVPGVRNTSLTVVEAPLELSIPATVSGQTLKPLSIPVDAWSLYGGMALEVISFTGPSGDYPFPSVTGAGPWQISWTPGINGTGLYQLSVRATNSHGQSAVRTISISIFKSVLSGDTDCNGIVDLTDLSRLINFLVNRSGAPICP